MFCPKCGNEIANEAKFCPKCGSITTVGKTTMVKVNNNSKPRVSRAGKVFAGIGFGTSIGALLSTIEVIFMDYRFSVSDNSAERLTIAMIFLLFFIIACACYGISLVFSILGLKKNGNRGLAITGMVISIISIVAGISLLYIIPLIRV